MQNWNDPLKCSAWPLLLIVLIGCGTVSRSDAGRPDSGLDAGGASDAGSGGNPWEGRLPDAGTNGESCAEVQLDAGQVCIERGWFVLSPWTTSVEREQDGGFRRMPLIPTYLDTFLIDKTEVTNAQYLAFTIATQATPPPAFCGARNVDHNYPEIGFQYIAEVSGWSDAGVPDPARLEHPVVCVTKREAEDYCSWRGGRLPRAVEFMKASRAALPDLRRFPWGDGPPFLEQIKPAGFYDTYVVTNRRGTALGTLPVGSRPAGASPHGVLDLAGSVSELVHDCQGELPSPDSGVLIRPSLGAGSACDDSSLVIGNNWFSRGIENDMVGALTVWRLDARQLEYVDTPCLPTQYIAICGVGASETFGYPLGLDGGFWSGPARRSSLIGFRCVTQL